MERRGFLKLLGSSAGALALGGMPVLGAPRRKPTIVVFTDIAPGINLAKLDAMLGTMLAQGLPVTCIIHTMAKDGTRLTPDSELAGLIRRYLQTAPGVIEIAAHVRPMVQESEFEQARMAFQARQDLVGSLLPTEALPFAGPLIQSIACEHVSNRGGAGGVRCAGVRNVLAMPRANATVTSEYWDNGVLRLTGGVRADLFSALEQLGRLSPDQYQNIILLSADANKGQSDHIVKAAAKVFSNVALQHEADQWITTLRLADLQMRDGYFKFERKIGLHLIEPEESQTSLWDGFEALKTDLNTDGIAFSSGPRTILGTPEESYGYWIETEQDGAEKSGVARSETKVRLGCDNGTVPPKTANGALLNAGVGLALNGRTGGIQGLDDCGNYHFPTVEISTMRGQRSELLRDTRNVNDLILSIAPEITVTPAQRTILRAEIGSLTEDYVTKVVPVGQLVRSILPASPLISMFRQTEAYLPRIAPAPKPLSEKEREALYEDAVTAWSYFYRFTHKTTGLCPATVYYAGGSKIELTSATMWDIGSHINALIAAVDIGLIEEAEFRRNIRKILRSIAGKEKDGRRLPSEWIKTNRTNSGNRNFDGSDAGRLLAALNNLRKHRFADDGIADLVNSWSLDKIVVNKRVNSVIDGKLETTYDSHYAHYTALGFRAWGFDVVSPYEVFAGQPGFDDKMKLLETSAAFGPIGAEPLLLEALDFGMTPQSDYLAEVLFGAQKREFDISGEIVCVSEGPIDQKPWFTYQGLELNAPDRTWTVDTIGAGTDERSEAARRDMRVCSSKAAFLWAAQRPNAFSSALLQYVRTHGRTPIGFASSIYTKTDTPTRNYSDINTSGIILQAIAAMLK